MKLYLVLGLTALASSSTLVIAGCGKDDRTGTTHVTSTTMPVTAMDQGSDSADRETTRAIRQALMADNSLSLAEQNITIVTNGGVVTLRGSVRTQREWHDVLATATAAAGANRIDDMVDIEPAR